MGPAGRSAWGRRHPYVADEDDVDFWLDMVVQARDEFQRTWPEAEFHVVLLDWPGPFTEMMRARLKSRELNSHFVFETVPDFLDLRIRLDGHPNAAGASRLADYMLNEVLAGLISDRTSTWRP